MSCWGVTNYAYVTNTQSMTQPWGAPQNGVVWRPLADMTYSPTPGDYTMASSDDCGGSGPCVGLAFNGRNGAWPPSNGCRMFGGGANPDTYGGSGTIYVK